MNIERIFTGVITLITGAVALVIYYLHKKDEKQKAAKIVLMEIREAESSIKELKKNGVVTTDFSTILPFNSWVKYNHLFVYQLDRDELDLINNFYTSCSIAEKEIQRLNSYLPLAMEQKARDLQLKLVELADKHKNNKLDYEKQKRSILEIVHGEDYWFLPNAPKQKLISYIQNISHVSTSTAGNKLKKVAKIN